MKFVTSAEIVEIVRSNVHGTAAVTVELESNMDESNWRKTGNPFVGQGIAKRQTLNGMTGYIYANAVNRIAEKEGKEEREAKEHSWGDLDEKRTFRIHRKTSELYLSMKVEKVKVHGFFAPDGTQIDEQAIRPFIREKVKSSTQADLEKEVIAQTYRLDNIKVLKAFGETYCLSDNMTAQEKQAVTQTTKETVEA